MTSQYTGVYYHLKKAKFIARITIEGETVECGAFDDEKDAARAVDRALIRRDYEPINIFKRVTKSN